MTLMLRRLPLLCCLSLVLLTPTMQHAYAGAEKQASSYIEKLAGKTLNIIQSKSSKSAKKKKLERLFAQNVDIDWVGRFVMGRFWRKATKEQKASYLKAYKEFILAHYASRFTEYSTGNFNITGSTEKDAGEFLVSMELVNASAPNDPPVFVDYRVRKERGKFQVFDVVIEGVSMITTQRSEFSSVVSRHGIDYLIEQLASKSVKIAGS